MTFHCVLQKRAVMYPPDHMASLLKAVARIANLDAASLQKHVAARGDVSLKLSCPKIGISLFGNEPNSANIGALRLAVESLSASLQLRESTGQASMHDLQVWQRSFAEFMTCVSTHLISPLGWTDVILLLLLLLLLLAVTQLSMPQNRKSMSSSTSFQEDHLC
jgi:hypothetical protein